MSPARRSPPGSRRAGTLLEPGAGETALFLNPRRRPISPRDIRRLAGRYGGATLSGRRVAAHLATFVRHPSAGGRSRHPRGPGAARPRQRGDHPALHARHAFPPVRGLLPAEPPEGLMARTTKAGEAGEAGKGAPVDPARRPRPAAVRRRGPASRRAPERLAPDRRARAPEGDDVGRTGSPATTRMSLRVPGRSSTGGLAAHAPSRASG